MPRIDISNPDFSYDDSDPEGFRSGMFRFGPQLGASETGTSIYEIPPGQAVCPYHYEWGEEEWAMVLQGRATVRTQEGTFESGPDEVWFFPKGPDGAHQIRNDSDETVRVMMWSQVAYPTVSVYPDSDKVGVWTSRERTDNGLHVKANAVDYFYGETATREG